jgi:hypothetical protein
MSMRHRWKDFLKRSLVTIPASAIETVSPARFDQDQPTEAPKAEQLSRTPEAKKFIACHPAYRAAVKAYAAAPAHKKAAYRAKMKDAMQAALREYHEQNPTSPAAEQAERVALAAANEAYLKRPWQPVHIEYSEALHDGPREDAPQKPA